MAHFYGVLRGLAGKATRRGSKSSGLKVTAASWNGAVNVYLHYDPVTKTDKFVVEVTEWQGVRPSKTGIIAEGVLI